MTDEYCSDIAAKLSLKLSIDPIVLISLDNLFRVLFNSNFHADLIILDIEHLYSFPGVGALDVIMALNTLINCSGCAKEDSPKIPVGVGVDLKTDVKLIREVLSSGYITGIYPVGDEFTIDEKIEAVTDLFDGKTHIPQKIRKLMNEKKVTKKLQTQTNDINLTHRQQQIVDLIVNKGASNKLIARMLNISESTVKLHMTQILKKHGLTNRTQLALFSKSKI